MARYRVDPFMNGSQHLSIEVLAQRLSNTDQAVANLQNQFSNSFGKLESQISLMSDRMASSGKTNWPVVAAFISMLFGLVFGGWQFGIRPIDTRLVEVTAAMSRITDSLNAIPKDYLSRQEYTDTRLISRQDNENRFRGVADAIAASEAGLSSDIKEAEQRIREMEATIVPRGEHEEHWRSQAAAVEAARLERIAQIEGLQARVQRVEEGLGGIYGASDVIRDMQARIDRLDATIRSMRPEALSP